MSRRMKRQAFSTGHRNKEGIWTTGGPPKRMTKGLRRHLNKVREQNPQEAERQEAMVG